MKAYKESIKLLEVSPHETSLIHRNKAVEDTV